MLKKIWNFFNSITLTIYLGLIFILISIIGSFYIQNNGEFFAEIDMNIFSSWLFNATKLDLTLVWWIWAILFLLLLLAINTFICSLEKIISIYNFLKNPNIEINSEFIDNLKIQSYLIYDENNLSIITQKIRDFFKKKNHRTIIKNNDNGSVIIYSDKGGWSKYAPFVTHIAFLMVLIGHLISSSSGQKICGIPLFQGQPAQVPNTDMFVRLNDVKFEYIPDSNKTKNYSADISIFEGEKESRFTTLKINHPVFYRDNFTFYVITYGFYQNRYLYILTNIIQDHGANTVFIASILMLIGLYCTMFITYRRFWVYISPVINSGKYKIQIGGHADNINFELEKNVKKFVDEMISK